MRIPSNVNASASSGQALRQSRAPIQRTSYHISSGRGESPSGLWRQAQRSEQPLKKTVVRMSGPSSVLKRWTLKVMPFTFSRAGMDLTNERLFVIIWMN